MNVGDPAHDFALLELGECPSNSLQGLHNVSKAESRLCSLLFGRGVCESCRSESRVLWPSLPVPGMANDTQGCG